MAEAPIDQRPTPMSGMPVAEVLSPPTESSKDEAILRALSQLDAKFGAHEANVNRRFDTFESRVDKIESSTASRFAQQADLITQVASAAAKAANLALEAKQSANAGEENARTIVESALRIHGSSIAMTVDRTVKSAVAPIVADIDTLKKSDEETAETLKKQDATLAGQDEALKDLREKGNDTAAAVGLVVGTQSRIATELGVRPLKPGDSDAPDAPDSKKQGRLQEMTTHQKEMTRQQKIGAVILILLNITTIAAAVLHK